jgi:hypothetical protein
MVAALYPACAAEAAIITGPTRGMAMEAPYITASVAIALVARNVAMSAPASLSIMALVALAFETAAEAIADSFAAIIFSASASLRTPCTSSLSTSIVSTPASFSTNLASSGYLSISSITLELMSRTA